MWKPDRGGLRNGRMTYQGRLNFGCPKPVTTDLDHVIDPPDDPEVTIFVALCGVAGSVFPGVFRPVLTYITIRIAINCSQHRGPWILENKITLGIVWDRIAMLVYNFSFLPKERPGA